MLTDSQLQSVIECAERNGERHGAAAGSWVIDGNTRPDEARRILAMIADGDSEWYDGIPAPLSGEWADWPTPAHVIIDALNDAGIPAGEGPAEDDENDECQPILAAYEEGYYRAYEAQVWRDATTMAGAPDGFPREND